jgi:hypothetical protein
MPSSLPSHIRSLSELKEICQLEQRLREPQADDALSEVRHQRHVIQALWQFKWLNTSRTGNKPNMRMLKLYKCFDNKMKQAAEKYQVALHALSVLDPNGSWLSRLKQLKDEDICGPGKDSNDVSTNSRYVPSWICFVPTTVLCETTMIPPSFMGFPVMHISSRLYVVAWQNNVPSTGCRTSSRWV